MQCSYHICPLSPIFIKSHFSYEILGEAVSEIHLQQHKIIYAQQDTITLALVVAETYHSNMLLPILDIILEMFLLQYQTSLLQRIWVPTLYAAFQVQLDLLIQNFSIGESLHAIT